MRPRSCAGENPKIGPCGGELLNRVSGIIRHIKVARAIEKHPVGRVQWSADENAQIGSIGGKLQNVITGVVGNVNIPGAINR
jgi:hypothetical protein